MYPAWGVSRSDRVLTRRIVTIGGQPRVGHQERSLGKEEGPPEQVT